MPLLTDLVQIKRLGEKNRAENEKFRKHMKSHVFVERQFRKAAEEITDQIEVTRNQPGAGGNVHFSAKPILRNAGGLQEAFAKVYPEPALVPASPWLSTAQPMKPTLRNAGDQQFNLLLSGDESTTLYAVQTLDGETWTTRIVPVSAKGIAFIDLGWKPPKQISVHAVNRFGTASEPATQWKD